VHSQAWGIPGCLGLTRQQYGPHLGVGMPLLLGTQHLRRACDACPALSTPRRLGSVEWFAEEVKHNTGDLLEPSNRDRRMVVLKQPVSVCMCQPPASAAQAGQGSSTTKGISYNAGCRYLLMKLSTAGSRLT
jgi:hypothetical protein